MQFPDPRNSNAMIAVTLTCGALCLILPFAALRTIPGLLLVFAMPGLAVMHIADPTGIAQPRAVAMIPGLSIGVTILAGLVVALCGEFKPFPITLVLTVLTSALFRLSYVRDYARKTDQQEFFTPPVVNSVLMKSGIGRLIIAVPMWAIAIGIAAHLAASHREFKETEFWLLPEDSASHVRSIGIRNLETTRRTYAIDLYTDNVLAAHFSEIKIAPDEIWTKDFALPAMAGGAGDVRAELFLSDPVISERSRLYRTVWSTRRKPSVDESEGYTTRREAEGAIGAAQVRNDVSQSWSGLPGATGAVGAVTRPGGAPSARYAQPDFDVSTIGRGGVDAQPSAEALYLSGKPRQ